MRLRRVIIPTLIPILILGYILFFKQEPRIHSNRQVRFGAPIPGADLMPTLIDARSRVDYPIPTLTPTTLPDPCQAGKMVTLALKDIWASRTSIDRDLRQVGLTYSGGVWMSVTPKIRQVDPIPSLSELPTVLEFFSPDDFPDELITGVTRGHVAWLNELGPGDLCSERADEGDIVIIDPGENGPGAPAGTEPLRFLGTVTAHIEWMENDVIIHLTGPYNISTLQALAGTINWI